ncbi:DNA-directed RNA polymerase I subunit RPA2 [Chamberlinius hualienensis]
MEDDTDKVNLHFRHLTTEYKSVPDEFNKFIQGLSKPHVDSFNYAMNEGLTCAVEGLSPVEFKLPNESKVSLIIENASVAKPMSDPSTLYKLDTRIFPSECRLNGTTYKGRLTLVVKCLVNGKTIGVCEHSAGNIPIMVKSNKCHLFGLSPAEITKRHEEAEDFGGYFVVNGIEKILRMLIVPRRNYPIVMSRPGWAKRGKYFTENGVMIRCVRKDQSGMNMTLHYLKNKTAKLMIGYNKEMLFFPIGLLLKALFNCTDQEVYTAMIKGKEDVSTYKEFAVKMLSQLQDEQMFTQDDMLKYIGSRLRNKMFCPEWYSDIEAGQLFLKECICVHLNNNRDKFNLLIHMTRKLLAFANKECAMESADNLMNHEVLLAGHLYIMLLKEKLQGWLFNVRQFILIRAKTDQSFSLSPQIFERCVMRSRNLDKPMEFLLSTGSLVTKTGLGLQHTQGLSVVADKLNYLRYISHFRSVHRGSFFVEMRTTTARKLLPEHWGFLCPVHTPDGAPCGLLSHLTASCEVVTRNSSLRIEEVLCRMGMIHIDSTPPVPYHQCYEVHLDGRIIGCIEMSKANKFVTQLRHRKCLQNSEIPSYLEICLVPSREGIPGQFPGLFLFSSPARMVRPVRNLVSNLVEYIGTMEQVYLDISVVPEEIQPGITTHMELKAINILSFMANLIPLSDFNQSPRNMYQCQMGKQTMGTPCHSLRYRTDNKLYRLQTPQAPLFRTDGYQKYNIDDYPLGTNAIVAVISYTGYDMEDAMVINKGSFERGFAHGSIIKNEFVNLMSDERAPVKYFGRKPDDYKLEGLIEMDGFAPLGRQMTYDDPLYCTIDINTGDTKVINYKLHEDAYLEDIIISAVGNFEAQKACFRFRIPRNPSIGDKFASRHGQKGICSMQWPQEDMPFTESGMTPDIIFNPHGFPSRMTIGMMIESMAGKSAALHSVVHNATPFQFSEDSSAIEYFGKLLHEAGYSYYGNEKMYSGLSGREIEADIFVGVVYYQRLRHMVADKFQVRSTGPVEVLTHQPVKGRKRGGGIRFGEMERDSLIAHGTSLLLHDRLFNCSDKSLAYICAQCGSLVSPNFCIPEYPVWKTTERKWTCKLCKTPTYVKPVYIPYVLRYFVAELASINVKVTFYLKGIGD